MRVKPGDLRSSIENWKDVLLNFPVKTSTPTDGVQYSSVATVGTTPVAVASELFDPGFTMGLKQVDVGLTALFTGLNGSFIGSINYYWEIRSEAKSIGSGGVPAEFGGAWVAVTGTYVKAVGTLTTTEDTFSGQANVASLPYAPLRVRLTAVDSKAATSKGQVKSSSYVRMVGNVLPGV